MLSLNEVSKLAGQKELFLGVSFHVRPGDRIGLIGPNGAGKSTLFGIILGSVEPDEGSVARAGGVRMGWLPQEMVPARGQSVIERAVDVCEEAGRLRAELELVQSAMHRETDPHVLTGLASSHAALFEKLEHLVGYNLEARAEKVLEGLGFRAHQFKMEATALSGGLVMRLELARLLLAEPDLLLLDEPTNHLDLESLMWLEDYLLNCSSALVLVSHDRAFLNRTVQRIVEIEGGMLQEYAGNYDFYLEEKSKRMEIRQATYKNQQDRIRQLERFIDKNRYNNKKAAQAQSRIKTLEKMEKVEAPGSATSEIRFGFPPCVRSGKKVMELANVSKSYGDTQVYSGIDLLVAREDKIAFMGPNGAGKSTLLKILAGTVKPDSGEVSAGLHTSTGYYAQHQWEQLNPEATVFEEVLSVSGDVLQTQLRSLLGSFLFQGDDVFKKTSVLSGGEKARLVLCKLLLQRPNFLLLDEPTNHLDIPSRVVLEKALGEFSGTICFISHDRQFINGVANKILVVKSSGLHVFPGNYDDYLQTWKSRLDDAARDESVKPGANGSRSQAAQKRAEAEWRNELFRARKPLQELIDRIERDLEGCHAELEALRERLADTETYKQAKLAVEIQTQYRQTQGRIDELTGHWESGMLELEQIEEGFRKDRQRQGGTVGCRL
ncbi:MAG: ABC-F family ATP-binding cassette domain-containing protein [Syntrophobacteraceae bacterium]|nr:ABC-F family ATP-binding cassette domain-containing protein [Syntrophobacteraceae bacterium]